jgi:hypothetical protein
MASSILSKHSREDIDDERIPAKRMKVTDDLKINHPSFINLCQLDSSCSVGCLENKSTLVPVIDELKTSQSDQQREQGLGQDCLSQSLRPPGTAPATLEKSDSMTDPYSDGELSRNIVDWKYPFVFLSFVQFHLICVRRHFKSKAKSQSSAGLDPSFFPLVIDLCF